MKKHNLRTVFLALRVITSGLFQMVFTIIMAYFTSIANLDPPQLVLG